MDNAKELDQVAFDNNVRYLKAVIPDSARIRERLDQSLPWQELKWGPRQVTLPRLCAYAVEEREMGQLITQWVCNFFRQTMGITCLVGGIFGNRYRNGNDYLPDHRDAYGDDVHVVSLSFGATRLFRFSKGGVVTPKFYLENSDMIIFSPQQNITHTHGIPKQAQIKEERINLTLFCRFEGNPYSSAFDRTKIPSFEHEPSLLAALVSEMVENGLTEEEISVKLSELGF
jgi:hypothetical protein